MAYQVNERVNLPVWNKDGGFVEGSVSKYPGDTITKKELDAARQTDDDIAGLVACGAMEESS